MWDCHVHTRLSLSIPFWLSRKRAELRAQNGGPHLDAVEQDMDYVKSEHEAGIFYARHFGWLTIEGFDQKNVLEEKIELSKEEIHRKMYLYLGYSQADYVDSIL
jgi:hypothetical protein